MYNRRKMIDVEKATENNFRKIMSKFISVTF